MKLKRNFSSEIRECLLTEVEAAYEENVNIIICANSTVVRHVPFVVTSLCSGPRQCMPVC